MRGTQAGRYKTGAGRLRPKRGKAQTRRRSRCGAAAKLTLVVCGHGLPFGGRCGWQLAEPFGSRLGAVGEPLGSRWGWAFWAVRGRSGAFGGVRGPSGAFGGSWEQSGAVGGSRGQSVGRLDRSVAVRQGGNPSGGLSRSFVGCIPLQSVGRSALRLRSLSPLRRHSSAPVGRSVGPPAPVGSRVAAARPLASAALAAPSLARSLRFSAAPRQPRSFGLAIALPLAPSPPLNRSLPPPTLPPVLPPYAP